MECMTCQEKMICYDDINESHTRIDWLKCPKCNSKAEIIYSVTQGFKTKVTWTR